MIANPWPVMIDLLREDMNVVALRQLLHQRDGVALSTAPRRGKHPVEHRDAKPSSWNSHHSRGPSAPRRKRPPCRFGKAIDDATGTTQQRRNTTPIVCTSSNQRHVLSDHGWRSATDGEGDALTKLRPIIHSRKYL